MQRPKLRHVHPELGRVMTPPECDAAGLAAVCFFELLATRHDGPLLGAAPEAMLSCQRDVAAMVLHDVSLWAAWVVAGLDGSAVPGATHVKLRGDEVRVRDNFMNDCKSLTAVDLSGLPSLTQVGERFPCNN